MFVKRRFILCLVLIIFLIPSASSANVYGSIYEFSSFDRPLKNAIVELEENSSRLQYKVSGDGTYSFNITPGDYLIRAKYYNEANILEFIGEEKLRIDKPDESRNIDIILFPPIDQESEYLGDINLTGEIDTKDTDYTNYFIVLVPLTIILIVILVVRRKKSIPDESKITIPAPLPPEVIPAGTVGDKELPDDLKELYEIIIKKGGRTTQKELRKEIIYGEAKVSLMITDLEDRGLIKKIKKGRSNIIIAEMKK